MKSIPILQACLVLLVGCSAPSRLQEGPGAGRLGAPSATVDPSLVGPRPGREAAAPRLPDRLTLPASYRLILLDGHLCLARESDSQALEPAPASLRIVAGEIARGELAYQPALLPQELAAEVAANRESSARMDNALAAVMQRSRELAAQALELQARSSKLAELVAAEQARAADRSGPSKGAAPKADPGPPSP
jgi:hypothetical protein